MNIDELERLAREAAEETGEPEDWFCADLIESSKPILSSRKARRYIAAASPDVMAKLIAVVRAAQAWGETDADDEVAGLTAELNLSAALLALDGKNPDGSAMTQQVPGAE
jgi:hypothetical protein